MKTVVLYLLVWMNVYLWLPPAQPGAATLETEVAQGRGDMWQISNERQRLECLSGALETYQAFYPVSDDNVATQAAKQYYFKCLLVNKVII